MLANVREALRLLAACLSLLCACAPAADGGADRDEDAGTPANDAGQDVVDAGSAANDAGQDVVDAGSAADDAGAAASDAGPDTVDAGAPSCDVASPDCAAAWTAAHNALRQRLNEGGVVGQPAPSPPLPMMTGDPALAQVAREHVERCVWTHNDERSQRYAELGGDGYVGENLYAATGITSPLDVVESWFSEQEDFDYDDNACAGTCGHYTQVVWRSSVRVGCASFDCEHIQGLPTWFNGGVVTACDYAPGGNFGGQRPY